ncbi:MAG: hypothetical protein ACRDYX_17775 [Egibacteraceae bacterium]
MTLAQAIDADLLPYGLGQQPQPRPALRGSAVANGALRQLAHLDGPSLALKPETG